LRSCGHAINFAERGRRGRNWPEVTSSNVVYAMVYAILNDRRGRARLLGHA